MRIPGVGLFAIGLLVVVPVFSVLAKSKDEKALPAYILTAQTVAVIVDPSAGVDLEDPRANQVAQKDVETALANWGRFQPIMTAEAADIVIVIRKGHNRLVDDTINDPRQNTRAGVINPTQNGVQIGAQQDPNPTGSVKPIQPGTPQGGPQTEIGGALDSFSVYSGHRVSPTDWPPAWRRDEKDGLHSHNVPVVDEFRKAVAAADKAAAKKP